MNQFLYRRVIDWIPEGARVLDLGTGDGQFLDRLVRTKRVRGEGVELDPRMVMSCIEKGLEVHQGDVIDGLDQYGPNAFDYALILGTFQELPAPEVILRETFRVSRHVIIAYFNLAYWRYRYKMLVHGKAPRTTPLPWYDSPNVQFFSILDFRDFCEEKGFSSSRMAYFNRRGAVTFLPNFRAEEALVLVEQSEGTGHE